MSSVQCNTKIYLNGEFSLFNILYLIINKEGITMPGFDPSLDKDLFSESVEFERSRITVAVKSYNEGTPKLQISRENRNAAGEYSFAKLGRMTKEEVEAVLPLIEKSMDKL